MLKSAHIASRHPVLKTEIEQLVRTALAALEAEGLIPAGSETPVQVLRNKNPEHGEFASNVAMALAKAAGMAPRKLAELLVAKLPPSRILRKTEIAVRGIARALDIHLRMDVRRQYVR